MSTQDVPCGRAMPAVRLLQTQTLINSWIKTALQHWHSCLVKCLQGAIALGLQGKIIKNTRGGENTFSFLLWKLLILWSPLLPLSSELFPVCCHWFWTDDQMGKDIILPNKIKGLYLGRSEFLKYLAEGGGLNPSQLKPRPRQNTPLS